MRSTHSAGYRYFLGRLRQARQEARLTQAEVGQRLGQRQSFVSKVESGERRLDPVELRSSPPSTASPWGGSLPRLKVTTFTVRASQDQARRWALVARYLRCRSVSAWLEELADEQSKRLEEAAADAARRGGSL